MIRIGDRIKNKKTNTIHIVESIDRFDETILVFTKDIKYIPINDIEIVSESVISKFFIKLFKGEKLTHIEESELTNKLIELKPISILPTDPNFFKNL
jgi:hypothetical protein